MEIIVLKGRGIIPGKAEGEALVTRDTIQGWSGIDEKTGIIIEEGHPFKGKSIKGRVLVLSGGKGSNGWSCHFHEARLNGNSPCAFIFPKMDSRSGVAAVVTEVPAVTDFDTDIYDFIETGDYVRVDGDTGIIEIRKME